MFAVRNAQQQYLGVLFILIIAFSISPLVVPSVAAGSAWTRSSGVVAMAGDTVSFTVALSSTADPSSFEQFNLSAASLPSGWSCSFYYGNSEINSINVKGGETVNINMAVATASDSTVGNDTFTFVATSSLETVQYSLEVEIRSPERHLALISPYPNATASVGSSLSYQVTISNNGEAGEYINLTAALPSGWSATLLSSNKEIDGLYLAAGGSQQLTVQVAPADGAGAGPYSLAVEAVSTDGLTNATLALTAELTNPKPSSDISIACSYPSVSGEEGTTFSFPVTISNRGSSDALLSLNSVVPEGWTATYSAQEMSGVALNDIFLAAGASKTLTFTATPPSNASIGGYTLLLGAAASDGGANASLALTASIAAPTGDVKVESRYTQMTANIGTTISYPITIENDRSIATTLNLLVASVPQGWSAVFYSGSVSVSSVLLTSHESISLTLQVTSPSSASIGNYTTTIHVLSADGTVNEQVALNTTLKGSYSLTSTPSAYNIETTTGGTATVTVTVTNAGLSPVTSVKLSITPPSSSWSTASSPITVESLASGASATFTVQLTSPSDAVAGDYLTSITATSDQVSSSSIAERVTVGASTTWIWIGLAIAAIAVVAMVFLFRKFGRR